jgi:hypothetical protein
VIPADPRAGYTMQARIHAIDLRILSSAIYGKF